MEGARSIRASGLYENMDNFSVISIQCAVWCANCVVCWVECVLFKGSLCSVNQEVFSVKWSVGSVLCVVCSVFCVVIF